MAEKSNTYRTKTSQRLTDADIEAMADQAECDYNVDELKTRRRGRPMLGSDRPRVVPARLDPDLRHAVDARAEADHAERDHPSGVAAPPQRR